MNTVVSQPEFKRALNRVKPATAVRSPLPALQSVLLEQSVGSLSITACNLTMQIRESLESVGEAGRILLPVSRLLGTVAEMPPGQLRIKGDKVASLRLGSVHLDLPLMDVRDFTQLSPSSIEKCELPQNMLKRLLRQTLPFVSADEWRNTLCGVYLSTANGILSAMASDGRRITIASHETNSESKIDHIIPTQSVSALIGLLGDSEDMATVECDSNFISVTFGSTRFTSKVIADKYPTAFASSIKAPVSKVQIGRDELQSSLRLMRASLDYNALPSVEFEFGVNSLKLSTLAPARVEIAVFYKGEPFKVRIDPKYALDVTGVLDSDDIIVEYVDQLSPIAFRTNGFVGAVMLLRDNPEPQEQPNFPPF